MDSNLDLDEYVSVEEETCEKECQLCLHENVFLSMQHRILVHKCSKKHLYDLLYQIYQKRIQPLRAQKMPVVELTRDCLENHFENHAISYQRSVQEDVRICKNLQRDLLQRMKHADGVLDTSAVNLWKGLSAYKLTLLKRLSTDGRSNSASIEPYVFD